MHEGRVVASHRSMVLLLLVVFSTFLAWSLRVAFVSFDALADLTVRSLLNEVLRAGIFVGPVLIYLWYVERTLALEFLKLRVPRRNAAWLLPLAGVALVGWFLVLDRVGGDGRSSGASTMVVLFTILSPATLVEEVYFRGFLLNKLWQATGFWRANLISSVLFGLIHVPGWLALGRFTTPFVAVDFAGLVAFGMLFGWAMVRDRLVVERVRSARPPQPAGGPAS